MIAVILFVGIDSIAHYKIKYEDVKNTIIESTPLMVAILK